MSLAYYHLYERQIKRKTYTEERITEMIGDTRDKGRLTDSEYNRLVDLIAEVYAQA